MNGDEPIATAGELKEYYERMMHPSEEAIENGLRVNTVSGGRRQVSASQVGNLTYCVSTEFGSRHTDVVNAMSTRVPRPAPASRTTTGAR